MVASWVLPLYSRVLESHPRLHGSRPPLVLHLPLHESRPPLVLQTRQTPLFPTAVQDFDRIGHYYGDLAAKIRRPIDVQAPLRWTMSVLCRAEQGCQESYKRETARPSDGPFEALAVVERCWEYK